MNPFEHLLSAGDLRTDGFADEAARIVSKQLALLPDLIEAVSAPDPSIRGHAADALEKVCRSYPNAVAPFLPGLLKSAQSDPVAMVRWHLAMVLGHLSVQADCVPAAKEALLVLLTDSSAFVRSWAITSLCILARNAPQHSPSILQQIAPLAADASAAVAKRARTAVRVLSDPGAALPKTWVKSRPVLDP